MKKRTLDFEVDVVTMISLLSKLFVFALTTAVWIPLASMDLNQSIGENLEQKAANPPSLWAVLNNQGDLEIRVRDDKKEYFKAKVNSLSGEINWKNVDQQLVQVSQQFPQVKTALVLPEQASAYQDLIQIVDQLKKHQFQNVGIAPL